MYLAPILTGFGRVAKELKARMFLFDNENDLRLIKEAVSQENVYLQFETLSRQIGQSRSLARLFRTRISVRNVGDTVRFFIAECYYIRTA